MPHLGVKLAELSSNRSAITANGSMLSERQIDLACQAVVAGKQAAHQLALLAKQLGLNESEFRLLWLLKCSGIESQRSDNSSSSNYDQKTISVQLALSPAQVSTVVEKLRQCNLIMCCPSATDRRRNTWSITTQGAALLQQLVGFDVAQLGKCNLPSVTYRQEKIA